MITTFLVNQNANRLKEIEKNIYKCVKISNLGGCSIKKTLFKSSNFLFNCLLGEN